MTKSTITRAQALEFAIANLDNAEVTEVLSKMLGQITKPRKAVVSKARLMNENLARTIVKLLPAEGASTKQIVGFGLPEVSTTQKAAAVMRVAVELEIAEKVVDKKNITYKPVENKED